MKKLIGLFLVLSLGLVSCSKDDNKSNDDDPIFSLEYQPLKSLSELKGKKFRYAGIKVEGKNASMVSETSPLCSAADHIIFYPEDGKKNSPIEFWRKPQNCGEYDIINFLEYYMVKEGLLSVRLFENFIPSTGIVSNSISEGGTINGQRVELQIGFQGKYLRIEDRMSNYRRIKPDEEVFLYFKE